MNARDLIKCASILISDGDLRRISDEVKWRTGINRAYYAAFLSAHDRWFPKSPRTQIRHKQVIRKAREELGADKAAELKVLYQMRQNADYFMSEVFTKDDALVCVDLAEELLAVLEL